MPIDPRIPLMGLSQPAPSVSPIEIYTQVAQLQGLREQADARRLAAEEARETAKLRAAVGQAYQESVDPATGRVDYPKLMGLIGQRAPTALPKIIEEFNTYTGKELDVQTKTLALRTAKRQHLGNLAQSVVRAQGAPGAWANFIQEAVRDGALELGEAEGYRQITDPPAILQVAQGWAGGAAPDQGFTLSPGQVRYGPRGEVIAQGPAAAAGADSFTLSPGSVRFSPSGERIAAVPAAPPAPRDERIVSVIGPDGKPVYVRESQALGRTPGSAAGGDGAGGGVKLTPAQQEDVATMLTVEQLIGDVQRIATKEGTLPGVGPLEGRFFASARGSGGATGETLRNLVGNIQGTIAKLRGGTAFSEAEKAILDSYTPTLTDTDTAITTKLTNLADFIQKKRANTLRVAAGQYTLPEAPTGGTTTAKKNDPLGIR